MSNGSEIGFESVWNAQMLNVVDRIGRSNLGGTESGIAAAQGLSYARISERLLNEQKFFGVDQRPNDIAKAGIVGRFYFAFCHILFVALGSTRQHAVEDGINAICC